jgi:hypothetical protein
VYMPLDLMIPVRPVHRQRAQLVLCPPVELLRLSFARTHEAHLVPQRRQTAPDGHFLRNLEHLESSQGIVRLLQSIVGLADLLPQHFCALLVPAKMEAQLLFQLIPLFGRRNEGLLDLLVLFSTIAMQRYGL